MEIHESKKTKFIIIFALYIFLLISTIVIFQEDKQKRETPIDKIIHNEKKIYNYMKLIIDAQKEYYKTDWNDDGEKEYAKFIAHLWRTVDKNVYPVDTNLIPKKLAFAMGESKSLKGYFFQNIYQKEYLKNSETKENNIQGETSKYQEVNYKKEWAITAAPADYPNSGILTFMATSHGKIWVKDLKGIQIQILPDDLVPKDWFVLKSKNDIDYVHNK